MVSWKIIEGSNHEILPQLPAGSVQTCVTSPPYFGLRSYGTDPAVWGGDPRCVHSWGEEEAGSSRGGSGTPTDKNNRGEDYGRAAARGRFCTKCPAWLGELGLEPTPDLYVEHLVLVFREVRRVLRDDGTVWVNLGDSYSPDHAQSRSGDATENTGLHEGVGGSRARDTSGPPPGCKPKDLIGTPWLFAFAMRADGWYLRSDIVWVKGNCVPEAVRDRPTHAHEYIFLFSKSERYFYDKDAFTEESGANLRSAWKINGSSFPGAHFAVFPPELPRRCVLLGSSSAACAVCGAPWQKTDGLAEPSCACLSAGRRPCVVLDIFNGSGTTGEVSIQNGRDYIGIERNPEYVKLARARLSGAQKDDLREGGFIFCPTCEKKGATKMFERSAVEKARTEGRKVTCPKCLGRFTATELGVEA